MLDFTIRRWPEGFCSKWTAALVACILATGCGAREVHFETDLARWEAFGLSGAVLVAHNDRIVSSRGYGFADQAKGIKNTPETLFDIASLGKQFTAAAIVKLAEEGHLSIQTSISAVIPDVPQDKVEITVHHLLTHTSGISDFKDEDKPVTRDELIAEILAEPLAEAPGSTYEYSNLGYNLLAAIVELASGEMFEDYLAHALFEPAGLRHTRFSWTRPSDARVALGYGGFLDPSGAEDPRERSDTWRRRGSGDVLSTTEDLLKWHRALWAGKILSAESRDLMFEAHTTAEADFLFYGYGWRSQTTEDGERLLWHSGLETPYSAMLRYYVEEDLLLVFLSNLSIGSVTMREVLVRPSRAGPPSSRLFPDALAAAPNFGEGSLDRYRGSYRVGETGSWEVGVEGDVIVMHAEGQEALDALFPPADDSVAKGYESAGDEAVQMARCFLEPDCRDDELVDCIDPLDYSHRDAETVASEWRRHGVLRIVEDLGTTSVRGRRSGRNLTHVRLVFDDVILDEHILWYANDEIYWLRGRPATFTIRFRPASGGGLVGFDLLKQIEYRAELVEGDTQLAMTVGEQVTIASRAVPARN